MGYDFINEYTSQLTCEYVKKMDLLLKAKLDKLTILSYQQGDFDLYKILMNLDLSNTLETKQRLEEKGYILEYTQPRPQFSSAGEVFKVSIDVEKVKLTVKKIVFEV